MESINNKNLLRLFVAGVFIILLSLISFDQVYAQCAMCKATLEGGSDEKQQMARGINTGILYLMVIPYIAISLVAYFWYKSTKKNTKNTEDY